MGSGLNYCFVAVCSPDYESRMRVTYDSLKKHVPELPVLLFYGGEFRPGLPGDIITPVTEWLKEAKYDNPLYAYCSIRPRCVLHSLQMGYDAAILVGADTEFFDAPNGVINSLQRGSEAVVTMYIHEPYEDPQTLYGNNLQVLENGQINADLVGFLHCDKTVKFLQWLDKVLETGCSLNGKEYVDQVWMSMCFSFLDNVKIMRHPGYNVAHYNMFQRKMRRLNGEWRVKKDENTDYPLIMFHYAGFEKGKEEQISRHQNRYRAEGDILEFLKEYSRKI